MQQLIDQAISFRDPYIISSLVNLTLKGHDLTLEEHYELNKSLPHTHKLLVHFEKQRKEKGLNYFHASLTDNCVADLDHVSEELLRSLTDTNLIDVTPSVL